MKPCYLHPTRWTLRNLGQCQFPVSWPALAWDYTHTKRHSSNESQRLALKGFILLSRLDSNKRRTKTPLRDLEEAVSCDTECRLIDRHTVPLIVVYVCPVLYGAFLYQVAQLTRLIKLQFFKLGGKKIVSSPLNKVEKNCRFIWSCNFIFTLF